MKLGLYKYYFVALLSISILADDIILAFDSSNHYTYLLESSQEKNTEGEEKEDKTESKEKIHHYIKFCRVLPKNSYAEMEHYFYRTNFFLDTILDIEIQPPRVS
ncbi:MAG: hypothetical protein HOP11_10580 [Saprospiraceae bacterium]|nr:hypothetical protein [Saprospiraceae bacterium]